MSAPNPRNRRFSRRAVVLAVLVALAGVGVAGATYQAMATDVIWTVGNH